MKTVATCTKAEEAHLLRARLEGAGIPAFVQDETLVQMDWLYSNAIGGVRVNVADKDLNTARAFLSGVEEEVDGGLGVACPRCGSPDTGPDELARQVALVTMLLLGAPLLFSRDRWRCRACDHRWKPEPRSTSWLKVLLPAYLVVFLAVVVGVGILVRANSFLNDMLVVFAAFGFLIWFALALAKRRPDTPSGDPLRDSRPLEP